jgi:hypothetical protein
MELSPEADAPLPTAVASAPAAAEPTPHSVEALPAPTLHSTVASACATDEPRAIAAELAAASNMSFNFTDMNNSPGDLWGKG